jgi:hypothetical protein
MRLLGASAVAASALAAACLSIPPYQPTVLVSYEQDGSGGMVKGAKFSLHFAGGSGFHFPDELKIDQSDNLLGSDGDLLCYDERGAGLSLYPTARISADTTAPVTKNQLAAVWTGPAVVQVRVDWQTQFACERARAPQGSSTFTVFPDGRIVRHDQLGDPNPLLISAGNCKCDRYVDETTTPDEFIIESYWTFTRSFQASFSVSTKAPPDVQPAVIPTMRSNANNVGALCLDNNAYQLASLQVRPPTRPDDSPQSFGTGSLIGHRLQQPLGPANLEALSWDIYSALFIEHGGCIEASKRVIAHTSPPAVALDGTPVPESPLNGVYGGDPGSDGKPGVLLRGGRGTLQAQAVPFAVWLRFPDPVGGVRALLPGMTGEWYTPQRLDDRNWIVWFENNPLAADKPIQIEPL